MIFQWFFQACTSEEKSSVEDSGTLKAAQIIREVLQALNNKRCLIDMFNICSRISE